MMARVEKCTASFLLWLSLEVNPVKFTTWRPPIAGEGSKNPGELGEEGAVLVGSLSLF